MEEKNNKYNIYKSIMIIIITALITFIVTTIGIYKKIGVYNQTTNDNVLGQFFNNIPLMFSQSNNKNTSELSNKINEIKSNLDKLYIGEINESKLIDGALEGYVKAVGDEYTEYLTEEELASILQDVNGSYVGVGLYIANNTEKNEILVIGVIEGSPAEKAGILPGDVVKKVDGIDYTGEQLTEASNKMKGVAGTQAQIIVKRNDEEKIFNVTREKIKFGCIKYQKLESDIGYIKITSFDGECAEDFKKAYNDLNSKGIKSLVIDLRNNGGGLVDECLKIAELIVPKGAKMLITNDKINNEEVTTNSKQPIINMPIVVLTNGYSASASEILTAAIKENTDAKVIGTKTFGKGVIQGIFYLSDKKTGLKVTIEEYFTPNHNKINKIGIMPDIEVQLPEELNGVSNIEVEKDTQLRKAIEVLK